MALRQQPGDRVGVRTAVRFPLRLPLHLKTENGSLEAITRDVSSNGILFSAKHLPRIGSSVEFTLNMPSEVMGWTRDGLIQCTGRIVRHQISDDASLAAAVIDEYSLKG